MQQLSPSRHASAQRNSKLQRARAICTLQPAALTSYVQKSIATVPRRAVPATALRPRRVGVTIVQVACGAQQVHLLNKRVSSAGPGTGRRLKFCPLHISAEEISLQVDLTVVLVHNTRAGVLLSLAPARFNSEAEAWTVQEAILLYVHQRILHVRHVPIILGE